MEAKFSSPSIIIWVFVSFGLSFLIILGFYPNALEAQEQQFFQYIVYALAVIHLIEAGFAYFIASKGEQKNHASKWFIQTFICGFFSLKLLLKVTKK